MPRFITVTVEIDNGSKMVVTRKIEQEELDRMEDDYTEEEIPSVIATICMREAMGASAQAIQLMEETITNWWERKES